MHAKARQTASLGFTIPSERLKIPSRNDPLGFTVLPVPFKHPLRKDPVWIKIIPERSKNPPQKDPLGFTSARRTFPTWFHLGSQPLSNTRSIFPKRIQHAPRLLRVTNAPRSYACLGQHALSRQDRRFCPRWGCRDGFSRDPCKAVCDRKADASLHICVDLLSPVVDSLPLHLEGFATFVDLVQYARRYWGGIYMLYYKVSAADATRSMKRTQDHDSTKVADRTTRKMATSCVTMVVYRQ